MRKRGKMQESGRYDVLFGNIWMKWRKKLGSDAGCKNPVGIRLGDDPILYEVEDLFTD